MAVLKHIAHNLIRQAKPTSNFIVRRNLAGWNLDYLDKVIGGSA